ncbi:MAG: tRNA pseudouridine(38-40) synthase TruA [Salegentibacter sp.]
MRYFAELAYFGKAYHGWQNQPAAITVQQCVEKSLFTLFQEKIEITAAGRTDAGVHARQMFAHFDTEQEFDAGSLVYKLNSILPKDIAVERVFPVKQDAHARFDALSRSYEYHIIQKKDPFLYENAFYVKKVLDVAAMNEAAGALKNYRNFKCFSKSRTDVKTYNCTVTEALWKKEDDRLIFYITADRFLRNMVRAVVGTLLEIGGKKQPVEYIREVIESENRSKAGSSVPAHGLYLTNIQYPNLQE